MLCGYTAKLDAPSRYGLLIMLSLIICKWKPKAGIAARFTVEHVMCKYNVAAINILWQNQLSQLGLMVT